MKRKITFGIIYIIEFILLLFDFIKIESVMIGLCLFFLILFIFFATFKLNSSVKDWDNYIKQQDESELTFKQFYSLWSVMPENFTLKELNVDYRYKSISFKSYIDYCRYRKFLERYKKRKKEMKKIERQTDLSKLLQRDLASKEEENIEWVKKNVQTGQTSF